MDGLKTYRMYCLYCKRVKKYRLYCMYCKWVKACEKKDNCLQTHMADTFVRKYLGEMSIKCRNVKLQNHSTFLRFFFIRKGEKKRLNVSYSNCCHDDRHMWYLQRYDYGVISVSSNLYLHDLIKAILAEGTCNIYLADCTWSTYSIQRNCIMCTVRAVTIWLDCKGAKL